MKFKVLKRKIKSRLTGKSTSPNKKNSNKSKPSFVIISTGILALVLVVFCSVQLLVVSVLSPRGKELKTLNTQKEVLLEENRKLEQEIAEYSSLSLIENRAQRQLDMQRAQEVIYVNTSSADATAQAE
jgi:cell division protein FtsB